MMESEAGSDSIVAYADSRRRRGMATYMGKDVSKLKAKGGKWKYMTEQEMLDIAAKFSPYRYVIDKYFVDGDVAADLG